MNRSDFLKRLWLVVVGGLVAPAILADGDNDVHAINEVDTINLAVGSDGAVLMATGDGLEWVDPPEDVMYDDDHAYLWLGDNKWERFKLSRSWE